ncbi:MAG: hypothetical protein K2O18_14855 [Oscillospiraceae bacterium]|nr:hypothetical protein [Oscillospiraceae bacterium]
MPNHVKNIVKMKGITTLPIFTEKNYDKKMVMSLDFEKIIPMPESLRITSGTMEHVAVEAAIRKAAAAVKEPFGPKIVPSMTDCEYKAKVSRCNETEDELCKLGAQYIQNLILHGATTWYDWCVEHWGTKWNAYENTQVDADTITFKTAWGAPVPVIAQLAKMYPEAEIEHWWADEDTGNNDGYAKYNGGKVVTLNRYDSCSNEAYETYTLCWGETKCLYKDENGIWHHRCCDDCHLCD